MINEIFWLEIMRKNWKFHSKYVESKTIQYLNSCEGSQPLNKYTSYRYIYLPFFTFKFCETPMHISLEILTVINLSQRDGAQRKIHRC